MASGTIDRINDIFVRIGSPAGASIAADLVTIDALHDVPGADVATNAQMRDVLGNKSDAAVTTVGAVASAIAYTKGLLNRLGAPAGASVSADIAVVDNNVDTLVTRLGTPTGASVSADLVVIDAFHDVPAADAVTNAQIRDVVGNKSDAAQTTVGTTRTVMAYAKGVLNRLGAPAGASIAADIAAVDSDTGTILTNSNTILTRIGVPVASLAADLAVVDGFQDIPAIDAVTNAQLRDVVGGKADTTSQDIAVNNVSLMRLVKGIIEAVNPAAAADNATAAASAYVSDTLGRKDDTASTTVNATTTMMRYIKGLLAEVDHATYGLSALEARVSQIEDANGGTFVAATDSLRAIRTAISALGGDIPVVGWNSNVPSALLLSDATVDLTIFLTDQRGNLITVGEITPGTCAIDEWNPGTSAWVSRLAASANSEQSGRVIQTEVFNGAGGYSLGRLVRIIFASISVVISGVTFELPTITLYSRLFPEGNAATGILWGTNSTGSVVADGTEQNIIQTNAAGDYIDDFLLHMDVFLHNMAGGDTTVLRVYKSPDAGANWRRMSETTFVGAQTNPVFSVEGLHGSNAKFIRVTLAQTGGAAKSYSFDGNVQR